MKIFLIRLLGVFLLVASPAVPVLRAQDLGAIKASMAQRLPSIDALKAQGALGENNQGLLEVRSPAANAASLAADENKDRLAVYAAIAQKTGASAAQIGKARARQIAAGSARGVWIQDERGQWARK